MSWDIVLFNSSEKIISIENIDENSLIEIDIDKCFSEYFSNIVTENGHVKISGDDYSIEYFLDEELVSNKVVSLYGERAIFELARFAKKYNFQIFDTGLEKMIEINSPEINGYKNFEEYLNQILKGK